MLAKICLNLTLTPVFLHIPVSFAQCLFTNIANNQLTSVDIPTRSYFKLPACQ